VASARLFGQELTGEAARPWHRARPPSGLSGHGKKTIGSGRFSDHPCRSVVGSAYPAKVGAAAQIGLFGALPRGAQLAEFREQALAEGGCAVCLEVGSDITGCHRRPGSSGAPCDRAYCADDLSGVEVERVEQEVIQGLPG
jgi:hypothetical protein